MSTPLKGWIKSIRDSKGLKFIAVTDGSKDHQLTVKEGISVSGIPKVGASFIAEGIDSTTPKGQPEFLVSNLIIVGPSDDDFPIQPKAHTDEFFRSVPELRGKAKKFQSIWKIRHQQTQAIHRILDAYGFCQYYTPIITHADCEGAGESFSVTSDWMDEKLTVSGQLHGEVGMSSLGKIYTFGPTFRAEKSTTRKHLSEFWMIEPEMAFCDLHEAMDIAEDLVKRILRSVDSKSEYEFKQLGIGHSHMSVADIHWSRITYDEICKKFGIKWGVDISSEMEQTIVQHYGTPVFITYYPADLKPFYMKKDDKHALCFDLIFPEVGEIIGGSQREEDYEKLKEQMQSAKLDMDKMQWYLATRKWGTVPHSGFGLGFDRLLMYITKVQKIHDVIPFPVSY